MNVTFLQVYIKFFSAKKLTSTFNENINFLSKNLWYENAALCNDIIEALPPLSLSSTDYLLSMSKLEKSCIGALLILPS